MLPRRAARRDAEAAVHELSDWIERRAAGAGASARGGRRAARARAVPRRALRSCPSRAARASTGAAACCWCPTPTRTRALERWYRRAARVEIAPRVEHAVADAGLDYERLTIRGQRTRWGSCSTTGTLSFNWRLLLAPEPVLDYVVWHEVCHLEVPDHSKRFWRLLARHRPGYREQERWLRRYGSTLTLPSGRSAAHLAQVLGRLLGGHRQGEQEALGQRAAELDQARRCARVSTPSAIGTLPSSPAVRMIEDRIARRLAVAGDLRRRRHGRS